MEISEPTPVPTPIVQQEQENILGTYVPRPSKLQTFSIVAGAATALLGTATIVVGATYPDLPTGARTTCYAGGAVIAFLGCCFGCVCLNIPPNRVRRFVYDNFSPY